MYPLPFPKMHSAILLLSCVSISATHIFKRAAERFDLGEEIGSGDFGTVYKAFDKSSRKHFAIKTCNPTSRNSCTKLENEIKFLDLVSGTPFIAQKITQYSAPCLVSRSSTCPFLVIELVPGMNSLKFAMAFNGAYPNQPLLTKVVAKLLVQSSKAVDAVHKLGYTSNDIHPQNFILTVSGNEISDEYLNSLLRAPVAIKMIDFGAVRLLKNGLVSEKQLKEMDVSDLVACATQAPGWFEGLTENAQAHHSAKLLDSDTFTQVEQYAESMTKDIKVKARCSRGIC
jgi:serine/threonine protein kinase